MRPLRIATVVGVRPNFIKAAAISRAIAVHNRKGRRKIREVLIHTGQHYDYDMSAVFFKELSIPKPEYHLGVGSGSHGAQTAKMLAKIEPVLIREKPDFVLVYGDTNSTLAGALAAAKLHLPVAHVEAGLRSGNKSMPEELNRIMTDHISAFLFCPSESAVRNLAGEGLTQGVYQVGDVMYDILTACRPRLDKVKLPEAIRKVGGEYALATIHRAENTDDPARFRGVLDGLRRVANNGLPVLLPLHPRARHAARRQKLSLTGLHVMEPLSYMEMLALQSKAKVILTDSGGIQKEAYWLGVPCITLRNETEWTETVRSGWNALAGTDPARVLSLARQARPPKPNLRPRGQGNASERILARLSKS